MSAIAAFTLVMRPLLIFWSLNFAGKAFYKRDYFGAILWFAVALSWVPDLVRLVRIVYGGGE